MLVYLDKIPQGIQKADFEAEVRAICKDLGIINPNWLMIVMYAESGLKLVTNGVGAYGFIQIMPSTAKNDLNTSIAYLKTLSWKGYMAFVKEYLANRIREAKGVTPKSCYELYHLVHYPSAYGKPKTTVLYRSGSSAYSGNKNLDTNKDATVTIAEIDAFIDAKLPLFYDKTQLYKAESGNYYVANYTLTKVLISLLVATLVVLIWAGDSIPFVRKIKKKFEFLTLKPEY